MSEKQGNCHVLIDFTLMESYPLLDNSLANMDYFISLTTPLHVIALKNEKLTHCYDCL